MGTVGWLNVMGLRFTAVTAAPTREFGLFLITAVAAATATAAALAVLALQH
jgi:hypothetical protein